MNTSTRLPRRLSSQLVDHTLVQSTWKGQILPNLHEECLTIIRFLQDSGEPMTILEISARLQIPRAVTTMVLLDLASHDLVNISPLRPGNGFLRQMSHHISGNATSVPPGLASIKIVVTGPPWSGTSTFIGSAGTTAPLHIGQERPQVNGLQTESLELAHIRMGATARLHLLAAPAPTTAPVDDVLWPDVIRGATGVVLMVHPHRSTQARSCLDTVRRTGLPVLVVVNDIPRTDPDLECISAELGVDEVHLADARSRPATRAALARLLSIGLEERA